MTTPVISGLGEVHPSRRSGRLARSLALDAINKALADADLPRSSVDGIVTESKLTPTWLPADMAIPSLGLTGVRVQALSGPVGAGILEAVAIAAEMVRNGVATHVLTYFAVDWGSNGSGPAGLHGTMPAKRDIEVPTGFDSPPAYFASMAHRYAHVYGLSPEDLAGLLCDVVLSARSNAARHRFAQNSRPLSAEEYLAQPYFAQPLRRADISLLSDGAVALIVSAAESVPAEKRTVGLAGWAHAVEPITDESFYTQSRHLPSISSATEVARILRDQSGSGPEDADILELYDCFSIATVVQLESLGVVPPGCSREYLAGDALRVDGALPVNTHGGLLAHGYTLGAGHVAEAVRQLRHEALGNQVAHAQSAFVGAGPGRQYTGLLLRRTDA